MPFVTFQSPSFIIALTAKAAGALCSTPKIQHDPREISDSCIVRWPPQQVLCCSQAFPRLSVVELAGHGLTQQGNALGTSCQRQTANFPRLLAAWQRSEHTALSQVGRATSYGKGQVAVMLVVLPTTVKNHLKIHPCFFCYVKNRIVLAHSLT